MAEQSEPHVAQPDPELAVALNLLRQYGSTIVTGIAIVGVLVVGINVHRSKTTAAANEAAERYGRAATAQDFERLLSDHPKSNIAPLAALSLAKQRYMMGQYADAMTSYATFAEQYPDHPLVDAAELGRLHCLEAMQSIREALAGFTRFEQAHPGHYLLPTAQFGKGRCLEQMKDYQAAKELYEELATAYADTDWQDRAEKRLRVVERARETGHIPQGRAEIPAAPPVGFGSEPSVPMMMPELPLPRSP